MALLWLDGFEGYGSSGAPSPTGAMARRYAVNFEANQSIETGRNDKGYSILFDCSQFTHITTPALTTNDTLIVAFAFKITDIRQYTKIMSMFDGGSRGMGISYAIDGELRVYRGDTWVTSTYGAEIREDTWYYLQYKVKCHDTTGTYELKINNTTVASASGVDTRVGANNYHDRVRFGRINQTVDFSIDDLSVCDGSGSINNDFIGNTRIVMLNPDGDDTANWGTVSPGPNHFDAVNEDEADDDTSYVQDSTANITDLFDYEALPTLGDIVGIQTNTDCRDTDGTPFDLITPIESNSSQYDDSAQTIGTTDYITLMRVAETDPDTGNAWTEVGLNAAKFGVKVG